MNWTRVNLIKKKNGKSQNNPLCANHKIRQIGNKSYIIFLTSFWLQRFSVACLSFCTPTLFSRMNISCSFKENQSCLPCCHAFVDSAIILYVCNWEPHPPYWLFCRKYSCGHTNCIAVIKWPDLSHTAQNLLGKIMPLFLKSEPRLITWANICWGDNATRTIHPGSSAPSSALSAPRNSPPPLAAPVGICWIALENFTYFVRCSSLPGRRANIDSKRQSQETPILNLLFLFSHLHV